MGLLEKIQLERVSMRDYNIILMTKQKKVLRI